MSTDESERHPPPSDPSSRHPALDAQVRARGLRPIQTLDDLRGDGGFESDEEVDEFLEFIYAQRRANQI
jgi:hypothetical protein